MYTFITLITLWACLAGGHTTPPPAQVKPPQRLTLLFVGDLMQHQKQLDDARTATGYDFSPSYALIADDIRRADFAIANFEAPLGGKPYAGYPVFSATDNFAVAAKDAGFDIFLLANNHILDRQGRGLERTIQVLDTLGVRHVGAYVNAESRETQYPLLIEKNGIRIALLNYTYTTNGSTATPPYIVNYIRHDEILKDIATAHTLHPDLIIACMHWGIEYRTQASAEQRKLAKQLLDMGVDHVVGSHPHVLQPIELHKDSVGKTHVVAYSLGNFISNMSLRDTDGGAMLYLTFEKDSVGTKLTDMSTSLTWVSRPAINGGKHYTIVPENYPTDRLSTTEQRLMTLFMQRARAIIPAKIAP